MINIIFGKFYINVSILSLSLLLIIISSGYIKILLIVSTLIFTSIVIINDVVNHVKKMDVINKLLFKIIDEGD